MELDGVIRDLREDPHRQREFYEYPELYEFFQSRVVDRDAQVGLLERFEPADTERVLEFGCGAGPLLARIDGEYDEVVGVDANPDLLEMAERRVSTATLVEADFTDWSAADEGQTFDAAALMGGLLHLTDDGALDAFAVNAYESLRPGGAFVTFFEPLSEAVDNGSRELHTVESDRYTVERHATSAITSPSGHYTTTYLFVITDEARDEEARMGTVFHGRFFAAGRLREAFADAGFETTEIHEGAGPTVFHARR